MSQETVYNLILRSKKPLSTKEISKKLKITQSSVGYSVMKLLKYQEIKFFEQDYKGNCNSTRRRRYYFVT